MAINTTSLIAIYEAEYLALATKLAALPAADVASMGRSISSSGAREALSKRAEWLEKKLAQLGAPVGTINEPFVIRSGVRA